MRMMIMKRLKEVRDFIADDAVSVVSSKDLSMKDFIFGARDKDDDYEEVEGGKGFYSRRHRQRGVLGGSLHEGFHIRGAGRG